MSIELKMPALSPTMEEGTLAKWLVKEGEADLVDRLLGEERAGRRVAGGLAGLGLAGHGGLAVLEVHDRG